MALVVVSYPEILSGDFERIQKFRQTNDTYFRVIDPHFAFVFPLPEEQQLEPLIAEIEKQSRGVTSFEFCLRCAALDRDASYDLYHVFLVPDEGHSRFVKLFEKLSAGNLLQYRRLDIDYTPHLGIGNSQNPMRCLEMIDQWNHTEFAISGRISVLEIADFKGDSIQSLHRVFLDR